MVNATSPLPPHFHHLSKTQAEAYLQTFLAELPGSQARLASMLATSGADPALARATTPDALHPIWEAAVSHWPLDWQEGYDYAGDPWSRNEPPLDALGPLEELPSWFRHDRIHYSVFAPSTLWVIDVLARHLGQAVVSNFPALDWRIGPRRPAKNIDRNKPVAGTATGWIEPRRLVRVLIRRQIDARFDRDAPSTLRDLYERITWHADSW